MIKENIKNRIFVLLITLFCFFSLAVSFISTQTEAYKIDYFCYCLNDYNKRTLGEGFVAPYVKVEKKENNSKLYNDAFSEFYYGDDCGSLRQYANNEVKCLVSDEKIDLRLYFQTTMSISDALSEEGGYRVDYGLFHAYFNGEELQRDGPIGRRFGCDTFMYISESFANQLLSFYGLENNKDNYLKLIKEEKYSKLTIDIDGTQTTISINNIVYNNLRTASRITEFTPSFGIACFDYIRNLCSPCIELDFKAYPYYSTNIIKKMNYMGYSTEDYSYDFFTFDYDNQVYGDNDLLNRQFEQIYSSNSSLAFLVAYWILFILFLVIYSLLVFLIDIKKEVLIILQICELSILVIYSLFACLLYTFYYFSLLPIALFIIALLKKGGIPYAIYDRIHKKTNLVPVVDSYFEIKI